MNRLDALWRDLEGERRARTARRLALLRVALVGLFVTLTFFVLAAGVK